MFSDGNLLLNVANTVLNDHKKRLLKISKMTVSKLEIIGCFWLIKWELCRPVFDVVFTMVSGVKVIKFRRFCLCDRV